VEEQLRREASWMKVIKFVKVNLSNDETRLAAENWLHGTMSDIYDGGPMIHIYRQGRLKCELSVVHNDYGKIYDAIKVWN